MHADPDGAIQTATRAAKPAHAQPGRRPLVLLMGNPNVGKTTLFNALTGHEARVGNYPGVTVERRVGYARLDAAAANELAEIEIADVPGAYSLSARSADEQIALSAALGFAENPEPDLVLLVVDAGHLVRNLYLAVQLLELSVPLVIAVNMIDEVSDNPPNVEKLSELLGVPCVATDARHQQGLEDLTLAVQETLSSPRPRPKLCLDYPAASERDLDQLISALPSAWQKPKERARALARWALASIDSEDELEGIPPELRARVEAVRAAANGRDLDLEIVQTRYRFLDALAENLYRRPEQLAPKLSATARIDRVLLHPIWGFALFVLIMATVFQSLFAWADPAIGLIEAAFSQLAELTRALLPSGWVRDLICEGLIGGVGNVVVFLPQILLIFLFIGIMEDTGYMARVAFLMDRVMKSLGLHGRAFVPMLSGFACAVPAIMATRTMERQRDRLLTMLVIPLMTCSARLPVYALIIAALFPPADVFGWLPVQGLLMLGMYLFSIVITLLAAGVLGKTVVKGRRVPLLLELPPYRMPNAMGILKLVWSRSRLFLKEAGGIILVCTVVLWGLLSYPTPETTAEPTAARVTAEPKARPASSQGQQTKETALSNSNASPNAQEEPATASEVTAIEYSYGGRLGKLLEPVIEPLGFDWKIGVGIIGAFAAREVFVSTLGLVYGIGETDDEATSLRDQLKEERAAGKNAYTPLVGLSLMVFFALACQCMSTLAVVRRETRSLRWPLFLFAYMTALAYAASLIVYQGGKLLGLA